MYYVMYETFIKTERNNFLKSEICDIFGNFKASQTKNSIVEAVEI